MFKTKFAKQSIKRVGSGLVATAIGLAASFAPAVAMADTFSIGVPSAVRIYGNSGNQLRVLIGTTELFVYATEAPTGCFNRGFDAIKEYQSLAQAALLAGKTIAVTYNDCAGLHYIVGIDLAK